MSTKTIPFISDEYPQVEFYSNLPLASSSINKIYVVLNTDSGKPSGFYYSNGISWYFLVDVTGGATVNWGSILGDINNQSDLINLFNTKENTFTKGDFIELDSSSLTIIGGENSVIGSGVSISLPQNIKTDSEVEFQKLTISGLVMVDDYTVTNFPYGVGSITPPVLTDNNNGTATISESTGYIFSTTDYSGTLLKGHVVEQTFTFTDGAEEYVVVDYNNGNPIMRLETNKFLINGSNIITLFICWRQGNTIHSINQGAYGLGLTNKVNRMLYNTLSYLRSVDGGLILSETSTPTNRTILVSPAIVYAGSLAIPVLSFNSSTDQLTEVINIGGVWSYNDVSVYDNISYNPLTGKTEAGSNKYLVRWFYRSIGDVKQTFYILGTIEHNTYASAETEAIPSTPILLRNHCMLIGRIIIKYGENSGNISSAFETVFTHVDVVSHNDTLNIQGGTTNEYYHLTASEHTNMASKQFAIAMAIALG